MKTEKIYQKISIFSDGTSFFDPTVYNFFNKKFAKCYGKDLKVFQKSFRQNSLNTLTKLNNVTVYRKKIFK
jgi:hypothetical protein|tara:strand:- start:8157 stop:8369 length:213 start_codon:yes stop_codon:yes gene_type:complete